MPPVRPPDYTLKAEDDGDVTLADVFGGCTQLSTFRSPFGLENWTLPMLEATVITGVVLALVHAIVRYRRHGDAINLALWFGFVIAGLCAVAAGTITPGAVCAIAARECYVSGGRPNRLHPP